MFKLNYECNNVEFRGYECMEKADWVRGIITLKGGEMTAKIIFAPYTGLMWKIFWLSRKLFFCSLFYGLRRNNREFVALPMYRSGGLGLMGVNC